MAMVEGWTLTAAAALVGEDVEVEVEAVDRAAVWLLDVTRW